MTVSCKHSIETSGSTKSEKILDQLSAKDGFCYVKLPVKAIGILP
jgi:hypothetical protein